MYVRRRKTIGRSKCLGGTRNLSRYFCCGHEPFAARPNVINCVPLRGPDAFHFITSLCRASGDSSLPLENAPRKTEQLSRARYLRHASPLRNMTGMLFRMRSIPPRRLVDRFLCELKREAFRAKIWLLLYDFGRANNGGPVNNCHTAISFHPHHASRLFPGRQRDKRMSASSFSGLSQFAQFP